jgi:hypothetical protein
MGPTSEPLGGGDIGDGEGEEGDCGGDQENVEHRGTSRGLALRPERAVSPANIAAAA